MATATLKGTPDPLLQHWEVSFGPGIPSTAAKEFRGIDINRMSALANQYAGAGWTGKLRFERDIATLTLSGGGSTSINQLGINSPANDITDKWEIAVDQERPDLCENENFLAAFATPDSNYVTATGLSNAISQQFFSVLRSVASGEVKTHRALAEKLESTYVVDINGDWVDNGLGGQIPLITALGGAIISTIVNFVEDYLRGATTFVRGKYVLRHTTSAPSDYSANVADFNVERIYSIAQLLSEVEDSSLWILPLPGYLAYKINSYSAPAAYPASYLFGALKMRSAATTAAMGRVEITTEYLIDTWPTHTYGTL